MIRPRTALSVLAILWAGLAQADRLDHLGTYEWATKDVVGLSGLEMSADGRTADMVGDRGWAVRGTFDRDGDRITGFTLDTLVPILGMTGLPVSARRVGDWSDAEGLAIAPDGTRWISFERWARVARFVAIDAPAGHIRDHPTFYDYPDNRQLEALAVHPDGTLYTFAERPLNGDTFPIYRLVGGGAWDIAGHITPANRFAIVGADFDADGTLYLLERRLVWGMWWQSRIRRLRVETPEAIETLWTSRRGEFYNLEGLSVWQDDAGLRLTLVSDDNSNPDEPAQFVEFRVVPDG